MDSADIAMKIISILSPLEELLDSPIAPYREDYLDGYADGLVRVLLELSNDG